MASTSAMPIQRRVQSCYPPEPGIRKAGAKKFCVEHLIENGGKGLNTTCLQRAIAVQNPAPDRADIGKRFGLVENCDGVFEELCVWIQEQKMLPSRIAHTQIISPGKADVLGALDKNHSRKFAGEHLGGAVNEALSTTMTSNETP